VTPSDVLRVREARRRLREALRDLPRPDPAIRIIELDPPRSGGVPLSLHPDFSVISGLSDLALDEVVATVDGLHRGSPNAGLSGTIIVEGVGLPLHHPNITAVLEPEPPFFNDLEFDVTWTDNSELKELVGAIEASVLVTSAESRGADATMNEIRSIDSDQPEVIDLRTTDADREEIRRTLATLNEIEPDETVIAALGERLERLQSAPSSVSLQATVEQYSAALERVQPTDPDHVRINLEKALDDAVEAQNAAERMRRSEAYGVVDLLATLGVDSSPETALDIAQRVIGERSELVAIRARLDEKLLAPRSQRRPTITSPRLAAITRRSGDLRRRLRAQQHMLTAARLLLAASLGRRPPESTINQPIGPMSEHGRALPILLVEPLADMPTHLGSAILSVLLRMSEQHQVICISENEDVHDWSARLGGRVGVSSASGWFAGDPESC